MSEKKGCYRFQRQVKRGKERFREGRKIETRRKPRILFARKLKQKRNAEMKKPGD